MLTSPPKRPTPGYCKPVSSSSEFTSDCINSALCCPQHHSLVGAPGAAEVGCGPECLALPFLLRTLTQDPFPLLVYDSSPVFPMEL